MGELAMKKFVPYGVLALGASLCLYSPIAKGIARYNQQKNEFTQEECIGQIEIPEIDVNLPIYNGAEEEVLQKGVGCMAEGSPLGSGISAHSVLVGHRGLPHAELFLRLDQLDIGDCFVLHVSEKELVYEVCSIQVIRPNETEVFQVQEEKDLVSLVTCTPYGINTHRLVVTGERKE